jgi:hypothetical protein
MGSSFWDPGVTVVLALGGILIPSVGWPLLLGMAGALCFVAIDWVKVWLFARLDLR